MKRFNQIIERLLQRPVEGGGPSLVLGILASLVLLIWVITVGFDAPVDPDPTPEPTLVVTVGPTDVPPTDVPPTDVPPTDVPPTDVPPTDVPPTDVPPTDVPPTDVPPTAEPEPAATEVIDVRQCPIVEPLEFYQAEDGDLAGWEVEENEQGEIYVVYQGEQLSSLDSSASIYYCVSVPEPGLYHIMVYGNGQGVASNSVFTNKQKISSDPLTQADEYALHFGVNSSGAFDVLRASSSVSGQVDFVLDIAEEHDGFDFYIFGREPGFKIDYFYFSPVGGSGGNIPTPTPAVDPPTPEPTVGSYPPPQPTIDPYP